MLVFIRKLSLSTVRWVLMCQGFSHFSGFLHHLVLVKLAISSIRVKLPPGCSLSHSHRSAVIQPSTLQMGLYVQASWMLCPQECNMFGMTSLVLVAGDLDTTNVTFLEFLAFSVDDTVTTVYITASWSMYWYNKARDCLLFLYLMT